MSTRAYAAATWLSAAQSPGILGRFQPGLCRTALRNPGAIGRHAVCAAQAGKAKSTILFFLCGGASHIDTWDMKPDAPAEYRGPFQPIATSAPGVQLCEHLPLLARQAHHLAVVRSISATCQHQRPPCRLLLQPDRPRCRSDLSVAGKQPHADA